MLTGKWNQTMTGYGVHPGPMMKANIVEPFIK